MSVKIRLTRMGSKKKPFYLIVAINSEVRRDGRTLDTIGYYNPMTEPADIKVDNEKLQKWLERGAEATETVNSLLKKANP